MLNPPTIKEELEHKAIEQIEKLALLLEYGAISKAQYFTGLSAVYDCTSGLVSSDLSDAIALEICEVKDRNGREQDSSFTDVRAFVKDSTVMFIKRDAGGERVTAMTNLGNFTRDYEFPDAPLRAALDKQNELTKCLLGAGWERRI